MQSVSAAFFMSVLLSVDGLGSDLSVSDQSCRVRRYEISPIKTGNAARIKIHVTMEIMPNFFAFCKCFSAVTGSSVFSACTELIRALIPMQEHPQMMLAMASFLWCLSLQQEKALLRPGLLGT